MDAALKDTLMAASTCSTSSAAAATNNVMQIISQGEIYDHTGTATMTAVHQHSPHGHSSDHGNMQGSLLHIRGIFVEADLSLPDDLIVLTLVQLSKRATKPSDFFNAMLTCRRFCKLSREARVLCAASPQALLVSARMWSQGAHRFLKECANAGNQSACFTLGMITFYCLRDRDEGASHLSRAAELGNADALYALSIIHFNGSGGSRNDRDMSTAINLCAKAAALGHIEALRELGHCLQDGYGIPQNIPEGRKLLMEANVCELVAMARQEAVAAINSGKMPLLPASKVQTVSHPTGRYVDDHCRCCCRCCMLKPHTTSKRSTCSSRSLSPPTLPVVTKRVRNTESLHSRQSRGPPLHGLRLLAGSAWEFLPSPEGRSTFINDNDSADGTNDSQNVYGNVDEDCESTMSSAPHSAFRHQSMPESPSPSVLSCANRNSVGAEMAAIPIVASSSSSSSFEHISSSPREVGDSGDISGEVTLHEQSCKRRKVFADKLGGQGLMCNAMVTMTCNYPGQPTTGAELVACVSTGGDKAALRRRCEKERDASHADVATAPSGDLDLSLNLGGAFNKVSSRLHAVAGEARNANALAGAKRQALELSLSLSSHSDQAEQGERFVDDREEIELSEGYVEVGLQMQRGGGVSLDRRPCIADSADVIPRTPHQQPSELPHSHLSSASIGLMRERRSSEQHEHYGGGESCGAALINAAASYERLKPWTKRWPSAANRFLVEWNQLNNDIVIASSSAPGDDMSKPQSCCNARCGRLETRPQEYRCCSACGVVKYCSRACQAQDWKSGHKLFCTTFVAAVLGE